MKISAWEVYVLDWAFGQRFAIAPTTIPLTWPAETLENMLSLSRLSPHFHLRPSIFKRIVRGLRQFIRDGIPGRLWA